MDFQFPQQLFPSFYNCALPDSVLKHCAGDWGSYQRVRLREGSVSTWTFIPQHEVQGETWHQTEPVPVPLLSPKNAFLPFVTLPDPLSFTEHMKNFFMDHSHDAFGCMSSVLGENFYFPGGRRVHRHEGSVNMWRVRNYLDLLRVKRCQQVYDSAAMSRYSRLLSDVVPTVPPGVLGPLLYDELSEQRDRRLFCEAATGGALAFVPFSQSSSGPQHGCLLYPGNRNQDVLNFHKVVLQHRRESAPCVDASSSKPFSFQLKGPIRQLSSACVLDHCLVGLRLDHLCGVWRLSERNEPHLLQVVKTKKVATCISVSPHVSGEFLVASESGAANLWTVGKGMQKVREEDSNLYFNARSWWRWCEFSAHPRVILYADRTGAELTDIRTSPASGRTLFRISRASECRSGERLILCRYLRDAHSFHHLFTTQYSAYIMDERFPGVPMLKLDHQMQSPPVFCHVIPDEVGNTKILLGSHRTQEITLLQYSGGRAEACSSRGPPRTLLRAADSLKHLPVLIPHRQDAAAHRLSAPATGLTCISTPGGGQGDGCLCVLQLTEAGDIFYQVLQSEQHGAGPADVSRAENLARLSSLVVEDTSSDESVIGPTQTARSVVAETPERAQSAADSEDSEAEGRRPNPKRWKVPVVVNEDPEVDQTHGSNVDVEDGNTSRNERSSEKETLSSSHPQAQTPLSNNALITWKRWLQKLLRKSSRNKPRLVTSQHFTISTEGLLQSDATDSSGTRSVQSVRDHLKSCMSKHTLVLSASVQDPSLVPVPDQVDVQAWSDPLSRRLTVSWQGEEAWNAWWEEELGTHKEAKAQALRRKRRREKEARRAAGHQLELSGSFSSSSCQSELDDFLDRTSSGTSSQAAWSDSGQTGGFSQLSDVLGRDETETNTLVCSPAATPTRVKADLLTAKRTTALERKRNLSATQEDPLQVEEEDTVDRPHPPAAAAAASSRLSSSQVSLGAAPAAAAATSSRLSSSQVSLGAAPASSRLSLGAAPAAAAATSSRLSSSQVSLGAAPAAAATSSRLSSSQVSLGSAAASSRLSSSQVSLGRPSQSSQPKKKSRMGF